MQPLTLPKHNQEFDFFRRFQQLVSQPFHPASTSPMADSFRQHRSQLPSPRHGSATTLTPFSACVSSGSAQASPLLLLCSSYLSTLWAGWRRSRFTALQEIAHKTGFSGMAVRRRASGEDISQSYRSKPHGGFVSSRPPLSPTCSLSHVATLGPTLCP
jgi:hypothetical protein